MLYCIKYQILRNELIFEFKRILVGRYSSSGSDLSSCDLNFDDLFRDTDVARQCLKNWKLMQTSDIIETIYKTNFAPGKKNSHSEIARFQSPLASFARRPTWIIHLHWCSICGGGTSQADGIICQVHQCRNPQGAFSFRVAPLRCLLLGVAFLHAAVSTACTL